MDLNLPQIFNISESTTNKLIINEPINSESTGRAVYPSQQYKFPQTISNNIRKPVSSYSGYNKLRDSNPSSTNYVYPVYRPQSQPSQIEINKLRGKGQAMDRYTPGEAVASALFKKPKISYNNGNLRQAASSQIISKPVYKPVDQKDLYSFPPNHSKYPPPNQVSSTNQISSYVPPAAGPADSTITDYVGPVSPEYLPTNLKNEMPNKDIDKMPDMQQSQLDNGMENGMNNGMDNGMNNGMDNGMNNGMINGMDSGMDSAMDNGKNNVHDSESDDMTYPTPPPGYLDNSPSHDDMMMPMPPTSSHDHQFDNLHDHSPDYTNDHLPDDSHHHPPDHSYDHPQDYSHDHHNFHHDHSPHQYSSPWNYFPSSLGSHGSHGIDSYPEIIYDDHDHHHNHHHHHHTTLPPLPPPPTTTEEPPPEPRVKKYSYFYLGRKLWYIPLYFTVWFSFYVLWLIIKSIARHKVNLPNHYQARNLMKRSIWSHDLTHKEATEEIDQLTISVMNNIDNFKTKYL